MNPTTSELKDIVKEILDISGSDIKSLLSVVSVLFNALLEKVKNSPT